MKIRLSKKIWEHIGKRNNWIKISENDRNFSKIDNINMDTKEDIPSVETERMLKARKTHALSLTHNDILGALADHWYANLARDKFEINRLSHLYEERFGNIVTVGHLWKFKNLEAMQENKEKLSQLIEKLEKAKSVEKDKFAIDIIEKEIKRLKKIQMLIR